MPATALNIPIALGIALWLSGCAKTGKGSGLAAGFADTLTIAYIPDRMASFPDFESYRNFADVAQELGYIDLAVRTADIGTLEPGPPAFGALKALAEDTVLDAAALAKLPLATGKLLLVLGGDYSTYKTVGTRVMDAVFNASEVLGVLTANAVPHIPTLRETKLHRHAFRALLYDAKAGTVFDTTMVATTESMRGVRDVPEEEPMAARHYHLYVRQAKKRPPPGPSLP